MTRRVLIAAVLCAGASEPAVALECDQYYAWGRPLRDATDAINAKINSEIESIIDGVNAGGDGARVSCHAIERKIGHRFRYLIFMPSEIWATNTSLVDRIPGSREDELRFREEYVYAHTSVFDTIRWMPPSPTVAVDGVRIGTDKLSHLFSEGFWYHRWYRSFRKKGLSHEEAVRRAVLRGVLTEKTILGGTSSGVLSLADLEANYEGMVFYNRFCEEQSPALRRSATGWRLERPFDIRDYVSAEWDESWQPNLYNDSRWKKVRPVLARYCGLLDHPEVAAQRASYRERDRATISEGIVRDLVREGKLRDPEKFSIDAVCGLPPRALQPVAGLDDDAQEVVEDALGVERLTGADPARRTP